MLTEQKFQEVGFTVHGNSVIDRHGAKYFPKKSKAPAKAIRLFCFECLLDGTEEKEIQENLLMELKTALTLCVLSLASDSGEIHLERVDYSSICYIFSSQLGANRCPVG